MDSPDVELLGMYSDQYGYTSVHSEKFMWFAYPLYEMAFENTAATDFNYVSFSIMFVLLYIFVQKANVASGAIILVDLQSVAENFSLIEHVTFR